VRGSEVDDCVEGGEIFRSECNGLDVLFRAYDSGVMLALGGDFGYERSGFASAEEEEIHGAYLPKI
jgi:hypothetical protein